MRLCCEYRSRRQTRPAGDSLARSVDIRRVAGLLTARSWPLHTFLCFTHGASPHPDQPRSAQRGTTTGQCTSDDDDDDDVGRAFVSVDCKWLLTVHDISLIISSSLYTSLSQCRIQLIVLLRTLQFRLSVQLLSVT